MPAEQLSCEGTAERRSEDVRSGQAKEAGSAVVWAAARAIGMTGSGVGAAALVRLVSHHDHLVRLEVAMGLPRCLSDDPVAPGVEALISLTGDPHGEVRDWATFGLGAQLDVDGTAVRDAMAARVDDPIGDTADEAMLGLARRHDLRHTTSSGEG